MSEHGGERKDPEATLAPGEAQASAPAPGLARPSSHPGPAAELTGMFGRYRIETKLGGGAMGAVYRAHDTQLDRAVALKVPRLGPDDDPEVLERFLREARLAAGLSHPNLCPVHDAGVHEGQHYLTMGLVAGHSLADRLKERGAQPEREAAELTRTVALALEVAHKKGVIHRDLKPANVMLDDNDQPVIVDFGLARRATVGAERLTRTGTIMGTPAYMPPEQVEGDADAQGPWSDVYSLGVILYEMLAGQPPFTGSVASVLGQIVVKDPEPPTAHRQGLDPRLVAICMRAMAKKPVARPQSMAQLASELAGYLRAAPPSTAAMLVAPPAAGNDAASATMSAGPRTESGAAETVLARPGASEHKPALLAGAGTAALVLLLAAFGFQSPRVHLPPASPRTTVALAPPAATPQSSEAPSGPPSEAPSEPPSGAPPEAPSPAAPLPSTGTPTAVAMLIKALEDPEPGPRQKAAAGLKALGAVEAAPALERRIAADEPFYSTGYDKDPQLDALRSLAPSRVTSALLAAFNSKNADIRPWAAKQLGSHRDHTAVPALEKRVATEEPERWYSTGVDKDAPLTALRRLAPDRVGPAVLSAFDSKDADVRAWAVRQLDPKHPGTVPALAKRVSSEDPERWYSAGVDKDPPLSALRRLAPQLVTGALLSAFDSKNSDVRAWAGKQLPNARDLSVVPALVKRIARDDAEHYYSTSVDRDPPLAALKRLAPAEITGALIAALGSTDSDVRRWAATHLADQREPAAIQALFDTVAKDGPFYSVSVDKAPALKGLQRLASERVPDALAGAMQSSQAEVREWAIAELSRIKR